MRIIILCITGFIALTAMLSGIAMMLFPDGSYLNLSTEILAESPFKDFFVPGFILGAIVGGSNLISFSYTAARHNKAYTWSLIAGVATMLWILSQSILVGSFYWLQWLYFGCGLSLFLASTQLKGKWLA